MRRKDREVTDIETVIDIINSCKVFRVAMSFQDTPYIIPLNFGYLFQNNKFEFYFHSAHEGKKIELIKKNHNVCFEMDYEHQLIVGKLACNYGYKFKSIIGYGTVQIVYNIEEKKTILSNIMKHQTGKEFNFSDKETECVTVCKIVVTEITAKARIL